MNTKQSELERIGIDRRDNHELVRNDYRKNNKYDEEHKYAQSRPDSTDHPERGKGTNESDFTPFRPHEKTGIVNQIDTTNGGGAYDVYGRNGSGVQVGYSGRNYLKTINLYNENNAYGKDSVEIDTMIDGQFFVQ